MKSKIGLLGGSFDPIHLGHIAMANLALEKLNLDEVWFIPTKQNPLKKKTQTAYKIRCEMIELALEEKMKLFKDDSIYTIDLIENLNQQFPNYEFYFIIGNDSLEGLSKWKEIDKLIKKVNFVVISRNNVLSNSDFNVIQLNLENHFESSSAIRKGEFYYLNARVLDYIFKHKLYLEEILKLHMSEKRFIHTEGVEKRALEIAKYHNKDKKFLFDLSIASLLHDICKEWSKEQLLPYMEKYFKNKMNLPLPTWHAYVGSVYVQEKLCIKNKRIIDAIYNHTIVEEENDFNLILKLADNLEENRTVIFEDVLELSKFNLKKAYDLLQSKFK